MYENCIERFNCNRYPGHCSMHCYRAPGQHESGNSNAYQVTTCCPETVTVFPQDRVYEGPAGRDGLDGKDLEFKWIYTDTEVRLAVREKGTENWFYSPSLIGPQGEIGEQGPEGERGPKGETGMRGAQGPKGDTGAQGPQGLVGPRGATGPQGPRGEQGIQGIQGIQGEVGPQGEIGKTGPQGPQGIQGPKGEPGDTPYVKNGNWWIGGVDTGIAVNSSYVLPKASTQSLGGVKVGDNLEATEEGVLSVVDVPKFNDETVLSGEVIEIDSPLEMESKLKISGNSEQDSRSGYNLFDEVSLFGAYLTDGYYNFGISTLRDTLNPKIKEIGGFKTNTQYTISFTGYFTTGVWTKFTFYYTDGTSNSKFFSEKTEANFIFVSSVGKTIDHIELISDYWAAGKVVFIKENTLQLEEGTEATPYEPYGVQPSPDYPSEIRSVKSKSDNLFDKTMTGFLVNVEATQLENGIRYTLTRDVNSSTAGRAVYPVKDLSNDVGKTIRVKCNFISDTLSPLFQIGLCDQNGENRKQVGHATRVSGTELSFVVPTLTGSQTYLCVYLFATQEGAGKQGDYTDFTNIMVTIDSEIKNYQPYGYVPVEVKAEGKNLFNFNINLASSDILTFNEITANSVSVSTIRASGWVAVGNYFENLKKNTDYTVTAKFNNKSAQSLKMGLYISGYIDGEGTAIRSNINTIAVNSSQESRVTFNSGEYDTIYVYNYLNYSDDSYSVNAIVTDVQLEEGTIATPYTPYVEPNIVSLPLGDIELRSTPDGTRDTFERVDGVWNKVEKISVALRTGTLNTANWQLRSEQFTNVACFQSSVAQCAVSEDGKGLMCNLLKSYAADPFLNSSQDYEGIATTAATIGYVRLKIRKARLSSLDTTGLIEWLNYHPLNIHYVRAIPTYTPITDSALIQALDELEQLVLHKSYNRITVTSVNGVKAQLELNIPNTAKMTSVETTEASLDMSVPVVLNFGDVQVKVPLLKENQMTINPATGLVKVNALEIAGKKAATEKYVNDAVANIDIPDVDLSDYYTKTEIDDKTVTYTLVSSETVTDTLVTEVTPIMQRMYEDYLAGKSTMLILHSACTQAKFNGIYFADFSTAYFKLINITATAKYINFSDSSTIDTSRVGFRALPADGVLTNIQWITEPNRGGQKVLATEQNYTTPYEPLYPGSPATKKYVDTEVAKKASSTHSHAISEVTNLQSTLDGKAPTSHNQAASTITAGTFAGQVNANATAVATIGTAQVRNISTGTTDLTAGTSALATGEIYFVYE